jgi:hypothetical protein
LYCCDDVELVNGKAIGRSQIALEFIVVYSFVLLVFIVIFALVLTQRTTTLNQQQYSYLQVVVQNVATYIDQAAAAGSGYSATMPLPVILSPAPYNISVTSTGVVIAAMKAGGQVVNAQAFSSARSLYINGTLAASANGISVYQLSLAQRSITFSNLNGVIYVDSNPSYAPIYSGSIIAGQSTGNLSAANVPIISSQPVQTQGVAQFTGSNSYITYPTTIQPTNALGSEAVSAWVYPTSVAVREDIVNAYGAYLSLQNSGEICLYQSGASSSFVCSSSAIPTNKWSFVAATYTKSSGAISLYINGQGAGSSSVGSSPTDIAGGAVGVCAYCGYADYFPGSIADVQIYSAALSAAQIQALYQEGIAGAPVQTGNVIDWWQLNFNASDYSGNGNQGISTNVIYQPLSAIKVLSFNLGGIPAANTLVGLTSNYGSFLPNGRSTALYTNSSGTGWAYLFANGQAGSANVQLFGFNGNSTTYNSLVGWWMMQEGSGNTVYDLSAHYHNGTFNGIGYNWQGMPANQTNFQAGAFNGMSSNVSTGTSGFPLGSSARSGFAWIYMTAYRPTYAGMIMSYGTAANTEWSELNVVPPGPNYLEFSGYGDNFFAPALIPRLNTWNFVGYTYSGSSSKAVTVYLNGQSQSGVLANALNTVIPGSYPSEIGAVSGESASASNFNGLIADVQIYNTTLTPSQVNALYQEGVAGAPAQAGGVVGWWPLDGNANDYSNYANAGVATNVIFKNMGFHQNVTSTPAVNMSPALDNYITINNLNVNSIAGGYNTVSFWMYWRGQNGEMPVGGNGYDLLLSSNCIGFSTGSGILVGSPSAGLANRWVQVTGLFYNGVPSSSTASLYINGVPQAATSGCTFGSPNSRTMSASFDAGLGYAASMTYMFNGSMMDLQIYNTSLSGTQIQQLYAAGFPERIVVGAPV